VGGQEVNIVAVCGSGSCVHSRRLWKWRFAVYTVGSRQVGVVAVLDNGRSGGLTSPQEAHRRISQ